MKNDISQSLGLDLDNINVYAEVYQNIPLSSDKAIFTFSEFEPRQKLNQFQMSFDNLMGYILSNINVHAKFHHNIPLSSRDSAIITFSEFGARQSLDQRKMSFCNLLG